MSAMGPSYIPKANGESPLQISLGMLSAVTGAGLRIVPSLPSRKMISAALRAGATSDEEAIRIYSAMIKAEE